MVLTQTSEQVRGLIKSGPHWYVVIHPTVFQPNRICTLGDCWNAMESCSVQLRGCDYPHVDRENREQGQDWISSWCDFAGEREYWKLFQSGQLAHLFAFHEDSRPGALEFALSRLSDLPLGAKPSGVIEVVELLYKITEIFEFSSHLALKLALDSPMAIKIGLMGIEGRILTKQRAPFWRRYYAASETNLTYAREIPLDELVGESASLAIECANWFFERFGWLNPPKASLKDDQYKLLTRTL